MMSKNVWKVVAAGALSAAVLTMGLAGYHGVSQHNMSQGIAAYTALAASSPRVGGTAYFLDPPNSPFVHNFNPFSPSDSAISFGVAEIYESLLYVDIYTGAIKPDLATSYQWVNNHSGLVFNLRHGVKWSNGTPFTANDVAFTFNMILSHPAIDLNALHGVIKSVKVINPYKVQINLASPNNTDLYYIAGDTPIVPQAIWSKIKNPATYSDPHPVTTGPFLVGSVNPNQMVLKRNPHYWDSPKPYLDKVIGVTYLSNNSATLAMIKGQFTLSGGTIPNINQVLIARNPKDYHWWNASIGINALYVNNAVYPFSIPALRWAMSDVINRPQLAKIGEYGQEYPVNNTGLPPTPLNQGWMDNQVAKQYPVVYSVSQAKKLLKKAGFKWNSKGQLLDPHGKVVSARVMADAGATDWIEDANLISGDLKSLGISSTVQVSSVVSSDLANGTYTLAMWYTPTGPGPYYNMNALLNTSYGAKIGQPAAGNYERFNNSAVNKLLNEYPSTFSTAAQHQIMNQLQGIFAKNLPIIPLLDFPSWDQYNTASIVGMPTAKDPYAAVFASPFDAQYILTQMHLK